MQPGEQFTPEKMEEVRIRSEEISKSYDELAARLNQYQVDFINAEGGMTPELKAFYENQKVVLLQEIDEFEERLKEHGEMLEEGLDAITERVMVQTEAILQKMRAASGDNPDMQAEVQDLEDSYHQAFGEDDINDWI